jgi:hypothetical protein
MGFCGISKRAERDVCHANSVMLEITVLPAANTEMLDSVCCRHDWHALNRARESAAICANSELHSSTHSESARATGSLASISGLGFGECEPLLIMSAAFQVSKMERLAALGLAESEFEETFARSSGPGGQHVNKVSTAVTLRHVPSGVAVTVQDSRSQSRNRQLAWERLLATIERTRRAAVAAEKSSREKVRRQKARRPWALKQRILEAKKRRSQIKKLRSKDW